MGKQFTLRGTHELRLFGNKEFRKVSGPKKDEVGNLRFCEARSFVTSTGHLYC